MHAPVPLPGVPCRKCGSPLYPAHLCGDRHFALCQNPQCNFFQDGFGSDAIPQLSAEEWFRSAKYNERVGAERLRREKPV